MFPCEAAPISWVCKKRRETSRSSRELNRKGQADRKLQRFSDTKTLRENRRRRPRKRRENFVSREFRFRDRCRSPRFASVLSQYRRPRALSHVLAASIIELAGYSISDRRRSSQRRSKASGDSNKYHGQKALRLQLENLALAQQICIRVMHGQFFMSR